MAQPIDVVLLDRVQPGVTPDYCVHGQATCAGCGQWVWLGDKTYRVVADGKAAPLCLDCAREVIPPDVTRAENLRDHRRADGPHE
jgi:hypothetical protein